MNKKITISILIAFLISFSILFSVNFIHKNVNPDNITTQNSFLQFSNNTLIGNGLDRGDALKLQSEFFSRQFNSNEKKIIILGSSEIKAVNTTKVEEYILDSNYNYAVYNLAIPADRPESRLDSNSIDLIIAINPELILYGISYRDFMDALPNTESLNKPTNSPLPDSSRWLPQIYWNLKSYTNYDFEFLDNPKLTTLSFIKKEGRAILDIENPAQGVDDAIVIPYPNAIFKAGPIDMTTLTDQQLKNHFFVHGVRFNGISDPWKNPHIVSFETIIEKFQQNDINVIIFTTPKSKYYLNSMPNYEKENFDSILNTISKKHNVKIYDLLWDKYKDMELWSDPTHIAINSDGLIYGIDIAEIILQEIEP